MERRKAKSIFCDDCGGMLGKKEDQEKGSLYCSPCDVLYQPEEDFFKIKEDVEKRKEIPIFEEEHGRPINAILIKYGCPTRDCDGKEAWTWQFQIGHMDEPEHTFYRCTTCKKTQRDYEKC